MPRGYHHRNMIPATSPVGSYSSNESEVPGILPETGWVEGDQNDTPTDFPNIRETISAAALQASPQEQLEDASHQGIACDNETSGTPSATAMSPRAYQLEMLDQSLKQNAIVVVSLPERFNPSPPPILTVCCQLDGHGKWQDSSVSRSYVSPLLLPNNLPKTTISSDPFQVPCCASKPSWIDPLPIRYYRIWKSFIGSVSLIQI